MKINLPKRKHPRLADYDYSTAGAYFITICTQDKRCVLSRIAELNGHDDLTINAKVKYTKYGEIAKRQLLLLEERYSFLSVDKYVIMPNHIHAVLIIDESNDSSVTLMDIVCAYKSLTTRECKKNGYCGKVFQTSFYEHIIRGNDDYFQITKYICENPIRWRDDKLYVE